MPALVVAALSARMLASSARRAGWDVIALDLFGDVDTRAAAEAWFGIGDASALHIERDRLLAALAAARDRRDCIGWVAGAGFEAQAELLAEGARRLPLLGNDAATIDAVRDPRRFFARLNKLGIPHPETSTVAPRQRSGWLAKDFASSGGWHVRRADRLRLRPAGARGYFQREIAGRPMSVLFVADGDRAAPIAVNALLARPHGERPYIYHGAIGPVVDLAPRLSTELAEAAQAIARAFGLRGLGSLDFILHGDRFSVLEVNPRPSSTVGLYDADLTTGLLALHVDACAGALPRSLPGIDAARIRGESIVFAPKPHIVTRADTDRLLALRCADVPQPASRVEAGAPLCTVCAQGNDAAAVRVLLAQHEATVRSMVQNRSEVNRHAD
ncbi:MAG TPA: ATP-grasp domain-containing protein [Burkholderiaceae bacterium]|nr:ATP-grasp domain-containing protein [Burkholderiaceae bacterium]